jgi:4-hydroxybenzoate polyprenyltransferase
LTILRARQWAHFLALPLAGFDPAAGWHRLALGCALATLALAYAYGLNAISDRATDLDPRKNPLVGHLALPRTAAALVIGCGAAALALASTSGALVTTAVAVSLAASTTYSVGPRWKAVPAAGTLLNAAIFAPLLVFSTLSTSSTSSTSSAVGGAPPGGLAAQLAAFTALLLQNQLLHEEADAAEDTAAGTRSTAIALGPTRLRVAAAGLGIAGAALAGLASPSRASAAAALAALLAGTAVAVRDRPLAARRRVIHRWVAFAGGALLFAATRLG